MAGCKTCCDDVPQQVLIERVLKSLLRQMLQKGELQPGLLTCEGVSVAKDTKVPSCSDVTKMIQQAVRESTDNDIRGQIIDVINGLILDGTLSPGLQTCDGAALGKGAKIATCADLDCAQFKCGGGNNGGGNNGGGTNPVDKYLTNVIIDEAAKTMTFKVKDQPDIVVDVTKFLEDLNDYVTNAVVDNAAKTVTLKVKNQNDVIINLAEMLQGLGTGGPVTASLEMSEQSVNIGASPGEKSTYTVRHVLTVNGNPETGTLELPVIGHGRLDIHSNNLGFDWSTTDHEGVRSGVTSWTAPRTVIGQPTFNNDTRVLSIPQERFVNGVSQGVENLDITIPATGNAPGGADNDTKVAKVEFIETNDNGRKVKVKVTDSAGATFETADLELDASGGIDTNTKIQSFTVREADPASGPSRFKTVKLRVRDTDNQEHEVAFDVPKFVGFGIGHDAQVGSGLRHVLVKRYYRNDSGVLTDTIEDGPYIPVAKLKSARLLGDQLTVTLNHTFGGSEIPESEQQVSVDLGSIKFKPTPGQDTPESTSGTALPTTIFGARDALLGKPAAFTEVVGSDGQTYLMPLFAKP